MSLIHREPSPEQTRANRANSLLSTGPRTEQGIANSSRNLPKSRPLSQEVARTMEALGESPGNFEQKHEALAKAMEPRDAWEAAWVEDIAMLRWRRERLQRAEAGVVGIQRRTLENQRRRAVAPPTGSAALQINQMTGLFGYTGLPDSARKFERVLGILTELRFMVRYQRFDQDAGMCFALLYGETPGPEAALIKADFESMAKMYKEGHREAAIDDQKPLMARLRKEIATYERLQSLYAAEHREDDPLQQDAELLLPSQALDEVIRYETHLEDQIERKLRQFYARRREPVLRRAETVSPANEEPVPRDLACQSSAVGA